MPFIWEMNSQHILLHKFLINEMVLPQTSRKSSGYSIWNVYFRAAHLSKYIINHFFKKTLWWKLNLLFWRNILYTIFFLFNVLMDTLRKPNHSFYKSENWIFHEKTSRMSGLFFVYLRVTLCFTGFPQCLFWRFRTVHGCVEADRRTDGW